MRTICFFSPRPVLFLLWLGLMFFLPGVAPARPLLHGHRPAVVSQLPALRALPGTNRLALAIGLPLRNTTALTNLLADLYNPASANYRHFLSVEEFTDRFGPTAADYQAVLDFALANGFTVIGTQRSRMVVDVSATAADIEKAFHVHLRVYAHPTEPREFFATDADPQLDLAVPVLDIDGLDNYALPKAMVHEYLPPAGSQSVTGAAPQSGSGSGGSYAGKDFRAAYVPGVMLAGTGQSVGIVEFNLGYYASDIQSYETTFGLPSVPLVNVLLNGISNITNNAAGAVETPLDIEMAVAMATNLSSVIIYDGTSSSTIMSQIASDNIAKQIGTSWTYGANSTTLQAWQQMAAQGQSFFNASGDSDAYPGAPSTPTDVPYITCVGGTTLTTTGPAGSWVAEKVWNWGGGTGSSGGISTTYALPVYQQGINMTANQGSTTMRNLPDVALTADNIRVFLNNGSQGTYGGTSCATPLWAAFTALVNQYAVSNGQPTIGFINPTVYAIGKGTNYGPTFHDITTGNNTWSNSPSQFYAVTGYDLCTGWGTPQGMSLISAMALGQVDPLVVTPVSGYVGSGPAGGPFSPASQVFTVGNAGGYANNWSLINTSSWFSASPTRGTLVSQATSRVTVSPSAAANNLGAGVYNATLLFSNLNTQVCQSVPLSLTVLSLGIVIQQPVGNILTNGGAQNFGVLSVGSSTNLVFTISNSGSNVLNLTGSPAVSVSGPDASLFAVTGQPSTPVAGGGSTTFTVQFAPTSGGAKSAQLNIPSDSPTNGIYTINVTGTGLSQLLWSGAGTNWDTTTAANWLLLPGAVANSAFVNSNASVLFDDRGSGSTNVFLAGSLIPVSVTVNATNSNYTFGGSGSLTGAGSFVKSGPGTLVLAGNNTYTGGTTLSGGTLQIGNGGSTGSIGGTAGVTNTAALVYNRSDAALNEGYVITGGGSVSMAGTGRVTLSGPNTYTGTTMVQAGELDLTNWGAAKLGAITVAGTTPPILGISGNAIYNLGASGFYVGTASGGGGTVNQTGGIVTNTGSLAVLLGNGNAHGNGIYNLSGGIVSCPSTAARGVMIGVNNNGTGSFNLSGAGNLFLPAAELAVGRDDSGTTNCTVAFNQTGGTASVGYLSVGGQSGSKWTTATFNLTGGSFTANSFQHLVAAASSSATLTLGGSAQVTLPAFPAPTGPATLTFDFTGGWLAPLAASTNYLRGLTAAYLTPNGASFNVGSGKDITVAQGLQNAPAQTGVLQKSGTGALTLSGNNTYTGPTTIGGGTLTVGGTGQLNSGSYAAAITNNGVLSYNSSASQTLSGTISGTGSLTQNGPGTLTLSGTNLYTGSTTVTGGTLAIGATGELYKTSGGSYVVTVNSNATLQVYSWAWAAVGSIGATWIGAGDLIVSGGTITYTGVGENSGANNGRNFTIGTGGATLNAAGTGTWHITDYTGNAYPQTIGSGLTLTLSGTSNGQFDNQLIGGGTLVKSGTGTWTLTNPTNTYTGSTTVSNGTLALGANNVLPGGITVNVAGGTLAMGNFNNTVVALQSGGSILARGTWGSSNSAANHISAAMTGTGILTVTTGGASTSVVTSSANPSTYGNSVTFTNMVTGSGGDGSAPAGTVVFYDGTNALGTGILAGSAGTVTVYTLAANSLPAGTHGITARYSGNASYDGSISGTWAQQVNPATPTVMVTPYQVTYDGNGHTAGYTIVGVNGETNGMVGTINLSATTHTNVGIYYDSWSFTGGPNYTSIGSTTITDLINQATSAATVTVNNSPATYNGLGQAATVTLSGTNTLGMVTNILTGGQMLQTNAGTFLVTVSFLPANTNYSTLTGLAAGNFTIRPAALTITAASTNKLYGQALTLSGFTTSGLTNSDAVTGVSLTVSGSPAGDTALATVGSYTITPSGATGSGLTNYAINYVAGTLTVGQLPVVLNGTRVYDGTTNAAAADLTVANNINGDVVTVTSGAGGLASANAGTNAITTFGTLTLDNNAGTNYTLVGASGSVIITNALLTITANNDSKTYDGNAYTTNNGVTYAGFVTGETNTDLSGSLTFTGSAEGAIAAGSYVLTPTGYASTNYLISYVSGILIIVQAVPVITVVPTASTITNGQTLGDATLSGGVAMPTNGTFAFTAPATVPPMGTTAYEVTYSPLDTNDYTVAITNVNVTVVSGGPVLAGVSPNPVPGSSYGVALDLNGSGFLGASAVLLTNLTTSTGASYVPVVNSDTNILVTNFVPGTAAASWNATVVNGLPSAAVGFAVTPPASANINAGRPQSAGPGSLVLSGAGGVPGYGYQVWSTTNLVPPVVWLSVFTNVFDSNGGFNYVCPIAATTTNLFLRLQQ